MIRFPGYPSRETAVAVIAGAMLIFTGWAWGGVILWTQFVTCTLGALALLVALTPRDRSSSLMASVQKAFGVPILLGLLVAAAVAGLDSYYLAERRASTLELIPDATLPDIGFADWGLRGFGIGVVVAFTGMFIAAFRAPTHTRATLLRFPPFWVGLALFSYIALQSLNPWGLVVERDLTWKIIPQDYISWLPSGLAAPFVGDDDPGGMNGWRQMLILSGPWMLLCALRIAVVHRRTYAWLAWIVSLNSMAIGVVGSVVVAGKEFSFLGFKNWFAYHAPFGPFVYRNHAGIFLYLSAAVTLALTAHLIAKKGDRADRGGPHLIAGLLFVMLCLAAVGTLSVGAMIGAGALLVVAPALYFLDRNVRMALSPVPALMLLLCGLVVGYVFLSSANLEGMRQRLEKKRAYVEQNNADDRASLRRATLTQIKSGDAVKVAYGWGAGCYRWTSPKYMLQQPEFVDAKGRLSKRANFAHCDWLQALLEWGIVGCMILFAGLLWVGLKISNAWHRRTASLLSLSAGILLVLLHVTIDFTLYFIPTLTLLALMIAWLAMAEEANGASRSPRSAPRLFYV